MLEDYTYGRFAFEGNSSGQHLKEDCSQRVNICPLVHLFPLHLLWRHILWRADDHPVRRYAFSLDCAGYPEIHDASVSIAVNHDVLRL
ncbi:hypothetical protein ES703_83470 [subsurface metagenome]